MYYTVESAIVRISALCYLMTPPAHSTYKLVGFRSNIVKTVDKMIGYECIPVSHAYVAGQRPSVINL